MRRQRTFIGPQGMGGMVALWGASSLVQSAQSGTVVGGGTANTATISAVDVNNSVVLYLGHSSPLNTGNATNGAFPRVELTNATTVTIYVNSASGFSISTGWAVIEFLPGVIKNNQRGSISLNSVTSNTAALTTINTAKSIPIYLGHTTNDAGANWADNICKHRVTVSASAVTALRDTAGAITTIVGYQVVEFF